MGTYSESNVIKSNCSFGSIGSFSTHINIYFTSILAYFNSVTTIAILFRDDGLGKGRIKKHNSPYK